MNIGTIIAVFLVIGIIISIVVVCLQQSKNKKERKKEFALVSKIALSVAGVLLVALVLIPGSFHTVNTGEVAVVKHLGEARNVRSAGTYFDFWLTESYDYYDAKVQNAEISTAAYSKDAQTMDILMTIQYQIDTSKAIEIANKYGSLDILGNRIQSVATEKAKSVLSSYSAMSIIETRSSISPEVEEAIKNAIDENYYVNIVAVVLVNIDFSDAFEATVENKMIAEQEKLKAEYEKETAIVNAEKELEVAKLQAQAKLETATADAKAQIELAKAEARALQLKSIEAARALGFKITEAEITDAEGNISVEYTIDFEGKSAEEVKLITDYLKYIEYLAKWDGKLPEVMPGDSASIIIPNN